MHARHGCCRGTRGGTRAVTGHQSHRRQFPVRPQQQRQQQLCNSALLARRPLPLSRHAPNDTKNTIIQPSSQARAMQHTRECLLGLLFTMLLVALCACRVPVDLTFCRFPEIRPITLCNCCISDEPGTPWLSSGLVLLVSCWERDIRCRVGPSVSSRPADGRFRLPALYLCSPRPRRFDTGTAAHPQVLHRPPKAQLHVIQCLLCRLQHRLRPASSLKHLRTHSTAHHVSGRACLAHLLLLPHPVSPSTHLDERPQLAHVGDAPHPRDERLHAHVPQPAHGSKDRQRSTQACSQACNLRQHTHLSMLCM